MVYYLFINFIIHGFINFIIIYVSPISHACNHTQTQITSSTSLFHHLSNQLHHKCKKVQEKKECNRKKVLGNQLWPIECKSCCFLSWFCFSRGKLPITEKETHKNHLKDLDVKSVGTYSEKETHKNLWLDNKIQKMKLYDATFLAISWTPPRNFGSSSIMKLKESSSFSNPCFS